MSKEKRSDVIIIGGGMVGLSLAIALAQTGVSVTVIEKDNLDNQTLPDFDGRVSAISLGSERVLTAIRAWDYLLKEAQPIHDIRVVEGNSTAYAHYNYQEVGDVPVGHMVENSHIRTALITRARETENLTLLTSAELTSTERDAYSATATLKDGTVCKAALLIAADGKRSRIRADAGIKSTDIGYNQTAIVCTIDHELDHEGLALERFLPAGPFAALPMKGKRSAIVWSDATDIAPAMLALPKPEFDAEISQRLGDYLGKISSTGKRFSYPLSLILAERYIDTRLALVGDAAHGIHPVAGQGVNVGFRDVAVLAQLIEDAMKLGLDIGADSLLQHYQQWRRFDVVGMGAVTDGITRLFSNDFLPLRAGRSMGLRVVNNIPPLKRLFMTHAMGLMGDLPRMMQEKKSA